MLPAASVARTSYVCAPTASPLTLVGDVQAAKDLARLVHDAPVGDDGSAQLEFVRLADVTAATVTGVTVDVMLGSAAATATLSDGTLLVVQMVREDGWRVRGVQSATPL